MRRILFALTLCLLTTQAFAAFRYWVPAAVSGAVDNGSGLCRLTVPANNGFANGLTVTVVNVAGATGCNVTTTISGVTGTTIDLDGTTFGGTYTSGGSVNGAIWNSTNTANWSATNGGAGGASVPGTAGSDLIEFSSNACNAACIIIPDSPNGAGLVSAQWISAGGCTNSCSLDFSVNNNNVTMIGGDSKVSFSGTGTRAVNMGSGTWTVNGTNNVVTVWDVATSTNLTLTANNAPLVIGAVTVNGRSVNLGNGHTYLSLTINQNTSRGPLVLSGSSTVGTLTVGAGETIWLGAGSNLTVTNAPTFTGTSSLPITFHTSGTNGVSTMTVASGTVSGTWMILEGVTFTGGATFSFTNSLSGGKVTGATVSAPSGGGGGGGIIGGGM